MIWQPEVYLGCVTLTPSPSPVRHASPVQASDKVLTLCYNGPEHWLLHTGYIPQYVHQEKFKR